jgi:hypothetical protein
MSGIKIGQTSLPKPLTEESIQKEKKEALSLLSPGWKKQVVEKLYEQKLLLFRQQEVIKSIRAEMAGCLQVLWAAIREKPDHKFHFTREVQIRQNWEAAALDQFQDPSTHDIVYHAKDTDIDDAVPPKKDN